MKASAILAVDPGKETGTVTLWPDGKWQALSFTSRQSFYNYVQDISRNINVIAVCEDWTPEKGAKTNQRDAWLIIGWLDGEFSHDLYLQQRGDRTWTTPGKLKAAGFGSIPNDHQKQAARHLVRWIMVNPDALIHAAARTIYFKVFDVLKGEV